MAGALGFEPRSSVLETDSLTVELTPLWCRKQEQRRKKIPLAPAGCLLCFFVVGVRTAGITELGHLESTGGGFLVLGRRIVAVFANRALQSNDFAH